MMSEVFQAENGRRAMHKKILNAGRPVVINCVTVFSHFATLVLRCTALELHCTHVVVHCITIWLNFDTIVLHCTTVFLL